MATTMKTGKDLTADQARCERFAALVQDAREDLDGRTAWQGVDPIHTGSVEEQRLIRDWIARRHGGQLAIEFDLWCLRRQSLCRCENRGGHDVTCECGIAVFVYTSGRIDIKLV